MLPGHTQRQLGRSLAQCVEGNTITTLLFAEACHNAWQSPLGPTRCATCCVHLWAGRLAELLQPGGAEAVGGVKVVYAFTALRRHHGSQVTQLRQGQQATTHLSSRKPSVHADSV